MKCDPPAWSNRWCSIAWRQVELWPRRHLAAPRHVADLRLAIVVDDDATDRVLAVTLLKRAGYKVMVCEDGRSGLDLIVKEHPNLIITNLITPNINGYHLARAVRFDPQTSSTPMVLQTAHYIEAEVRQLAAQIGVQEVLVKPYEPQAFRHAIAKAVGD